MPEINSFAASRNGKDAISEHYATVKNKVPGWLLDASPDTHRTMRQAGFKPLPWFEQARGADPGAARHLASLYADHRLYEQQINAVLASLPTAEAFAEPLLKAAIHDTFGLEVDVRTAHLFHARRAADAGVRFPPYPPLLPPGAMAAAVQPLLKSALQNFEAWETSPGAMDSGNTRSVVVSTARIEGMNVDGTVLDIAPEKFAAICRNLDLGHKYQALITSVLNPSSAPGDAPDAAAFNMRGVFKSFEQSAFLLQVQLAFMRSLIDEQTCDALRHLAKNKPATLKGKPLACRFLRLWGVTLTGIVVISPDRESSTGIEPVVVYIPDDPFHPLQAYASSQQFIEVLRDSMLQPGYLTFFERFVPARDRALVFGNIHQAFYPRVLNSGGWYEVKLDRKARLRVEEQPFAGQLFSALYRQKVAVLKDDGLFHAVPTAVEDRKSFDAALQYFLEKTFQALNIAAFVVPGLGEVMLGVMAVQLSYETFEGIECLTRGEREQAWGYFMDVVENVAMVTALGALGSSGRGIPAVEIPHAVGQMRAVRVPDGSTRLWTPDLTPFAHDTVLPAGLTPNEAGFIEYQGKQWWPLDGQTYAVKPPLATEPYRLEHPVRGDAYAPRLRHNGAGAWLHELDQPREWQGLYLFRRLGYTPARFSDEEALRILRISDTPDAVLRHTLAEAQRAPALLEDTAQRWQLDRELGRLVEQGEAGDLRARRTERFNSRYAGLYVSRPAQAVVRRSFPGLPLPVVDELLQHASSAELQRLTSTRRVPMRIAEEARAYLQNVRLARACEGIYLDSVDSADSERLQLHSIARLPGWSPLVRVELREAQFHGALIDRVGRADAPIRKVLVRQEGAGYQAHDADGEPLQGRADFYASLLHALPDRQRAELGFPHVGQGADLKQAVQRLPLLPRPVAREVLRMQPLKPAARSPMRLADGRLGYPLSGRGQLPGFITEDNMLDKIRLLEFQQAHPDEILRDLYRIGLSRAAIDSRLNQLLEEQRELRHSLDQWAQASASLTSPNELRSISRTGIGDALWHHWEANSLPETGRAAPLRLENVRLSDFPEQLPAFVADRVQSLEVIGPDGGALPALGDFFRRFPHATSLAVRGGEGLNSRELIASLRDAAPQVRSLALTDGALEVTQEALDGLRGLTHLERLDLSGNWLSAAGGEVDVASLPFMALRYLGLERLALASWPEWLDSRALGRLAEVSLADNAISQLPAWLLDNEARGAALGTRVSLLRNRLTAQTIRHLRFGEGIDRRFSFDLDALQLQRGFDQLRGEHRVLSEALDQWVEASTSTAVPSEAQLLARRRVRDTLLAFWRERSASTVPRLQLETMALDDFPQALPPFFYAAVEQMELIRPLANIEQFNRFLRRFPKLRGLKLTGHVTPLTVLPAALLELPELTALALNDQGLIIDQQVIEFLCSIPELTYLGLDGNTMGNILDCTPLLDRYWTLLSLNNVGLQSWPVWLDELLPELVEMLGLEYNAITELPQYLLENRRNSNPNIHVEIALTGNPLPAEVVRQAYVSQSWNRPYTFHMEVPEEVQRLAPDRHDSDSQSTGSDVEGLEPSLSNGEPGPQASAVEPWLAGEEDRSDARRQLWRQLEAGNDARDLLGLIGRLRHTADYRGAGSRPELVERVWHVLAAAAQDTDFRLTLNGMAEEPLRQVRNHDTCPDGIRLEFNQMELQLYIRQSLRDVPEHARGQTLYQLTRRLFRSQALDDSARRASGGRDEAEVRLAYRLHWANELDLPVPPGKMLYQLAAHIRPGELDSALMQVYQAEQGHGFLAYASQRDFWVEYLRETNSDRFNDLKETFEARVLELTDLYPGDTTDELSARIKVLEEQFSNDERQLVEELTLREGERFNAG